MFRTYVLGTAGVALVLLAGIAIFTGRVDPFWLYTLPSDRETRRDFEVIKQYSRLHKPYAMLRYRPDQLIIGSSRVCSLSPTALGPDAYNAFQNGISMKEMRRTIEHANAIRPLQSLYIGIGHQLFLTGRQEDVGDFEDNRLLRSPLSVGDRLAFYFQVFKDAWSSLLSVDALASAVAYLNAPPLDTRYYMANGSRHGPPSIFAYNIVFGRITGEFRDTAQELDYEEFRSLLELTRQQRIPTQLFINPYHGSMLTAIAFNDAWDHYLDWQRAVVHLVTSEFPEIPVYGMEANAAAILEPLQAEDPFFLDGLHTSTRAGEEVVRCFTDPACRAGGLLTPLNDDNIESYLAEVTRLLALYKERNPEDYARLQKWRAQKVKG